MTRPPTGTLIRRALRLKCPRCGEGAMFSGLFRTLDRCPHCDLKFEREPGYFLGSIYLNYGITALVSTVTWVVLRFGYNYPATPILSGLLIFCIVFPSFFFRYARGLWLALDLAFDEKLFAGMKGPPAAVGGPTGDTLVDVYQAANETEAHFLRGMLAVAGIEAVVVGDEMQAIGYLPFARPRLRVMASRAVESRAILMDWEASHRQPKDPQSRPVLWKCPACGTEVEDGFELCWNCQSPRVRS